MNRRQNRAMDNWLAAEAAGDDAGAESALSSLFAWVPRLAPSPEFVDRVLAAAPIAARRAAPFVWAWRWSVAAALAITGIAVSFLPALRWVPFSMPSVSDVVKAAAGATGAVGEWLQTGLAVWAVMQRIGGLALVAVQTPEALAGLAGSVVVSAAALYTLNHLLTLERRSW